MKEFSKDMPPYNICESERERVGCTGNCRFVGQALERPNNVTKAFI
jgi:hypothetical protein